MKQRSAGRRASYWLTLVPRPSQLLPHTSFIQCMTIAGKDVI